MRSLRRRGFLEAMSLLLLAAFFAAQAFACCQANARFGRVVASWFAPAPAPVHACCAKTAPAAHAPGKPDCARECCIQDAAKHAPQLASAPSEVPGLCGALAFSLPLPALRAADAMRPAPVADTGPPLYLRTLRLLV
jgi:hypothetical protein